MAGFTAENSKIDSIEVENFMSIGRGRVDFDARGVVTLCGYNDSGKSAITRLLEVMFYNAYSAEQVNFIRDGEAYWKGTINFTDGVSVTKEKHIDGKTVWGMEKNGKTLFTNKLDNGDVASMGQDVPRVIADYLGVIKDEQTGEKLNVRRNTDKLFLINTSGGENYKILNSILQSDVLTEASRRIIEDKNKEKRKQDALEGERTAVQNRYDKISVIEDGKLKEVTSLSEKTNENGKRLKRTISLVEVRDEYVGITVQKELEGVQTKSLMLLKEVVESREVAKAPVQSELNSIDPSRLLLLGEVVKRRAESGNDVQDRLELLPLERHSEIMDVGKKFNEYCNILENIRKIDMEKAGLVEQIQKLVDANGLEMCRNCGSVV